jgi:FkbM family methyltransferase
MVLDCVLRGLNIKKGTYLDMGAHHPYYFSNTQFLYEKGFRGVNCEPNPYLHKIFLKKRKDDINLNIGISIGENNSEQDFYIMNPSTLSTFSKEEANRYVEESGHSIEKIIKAKIYNINGIIEQYCKQVPNLITIDIEGLDYAVLKTLDFDKYKPDVFCIEIAEYHTDGSYKRIKEIDELMNANGYFIYADLYQNTIYVNKNKWDKKKATDYVYNKN